MTARQLVFKTLVKMDKQGSYSNILLDKGLEKSQLEPRDKAFATSLFYGVLERKITLDYIISHYCTQGLGQTSVEVKTALRMGIYQLMFMGGVSDFAAVDECVKLLKATKFEKATGFVNAVLRQFIRDEKKLLPNKKGEIPEYALYSAPTWLIEKWSKEYSKQMAINVLKDSLKKPPVTLKVNNLKATAQTVIERLAQEGIECEDLSNRFPKLGGVLKLISSSADNTQAFADGLFHVQDISCMLACLALEVGENQKILDMCAAPGGKTFTLAELCNCKSEILSCDLHQKRVNLIKNGVSRLGLGNVKCMQNDAKEYNERFFGADRILCDVPCSGLGVIRRKPEIKYKSLEDFARLPQIQYDILSSCSKYLKIGGILVYSTCTLSKAENEKVIETFLQNNDNFAPAPIEFFEGNPSKVTIFPTDFGSDGFFIAKLTRIR